MPNYNDYLKKVKTVESGGKASAKNPHSSATGLYQFTEGTWKYISDKHKLGYSLEDRLDPKKQEVAMYYLTKENEAVLKPVLGRDLDDTDKYLAHFLGAGGASKLYRTMQQNPNAPINSVMSPRELSANKSVVFNKDGSLKTVKDIYNWAGKKMGTSFSAGKEETENLPLPQPKSSEISYLTDTNLFPTFTPQEQQIQEQVQPNYSHIQKLIEQAQVQYVAPEEEQFQAGGEKNSLWKNIRENRGSGKKPTKEMLEQERKIKSKYQDGGEKRFIEDLINNKIPISKDGVFASGDKPVIVPSSEISMRGVNYPILGTDNEGNSKMMMPGQEYKFPGDFVFEVPMMQAGGFKDEGERKDSITVKETTKTELPKFNKVQPKEKQKDLSNLTLEQAKKMLPFLEDESKGVFLGDTYYSRQGELDEVVVSTKKPISLDKLKEKEITSLNEENVKKIQKELLEKGYLESNAIPEPSNEDEVKSIQKALVSKGYDLGKYGENKDGVDGKYGSKTKQALEQYNLKLSGVDGKAGDKTKEAFRLYKADNLLSKTDINKVNERFFEFSKDTDIKDYQSNLQKQGYFKGIDYKKPTDKDIVKREVDNIFPLNDNKTCTDTRCTWYVGKEIEKKVKEEGRTKLDAYGSGWEISERMINKGAKEIYSVFEDKKPNLKSSEIEPYIKKRINQTGQLDAKKVKSGDVLNLFYEGSDFKDEAYTKGTKYFTSHTGMVKQDKKGKLYVEHNVGGTIFKDDLEQVAKGQVKNKKGKDLSIAAVIRPNYNLPEKAEFYDSTEAQVNEFTTTNYTKLGSKNAALFTQTLIKNKEALQKDIPLNDEEFSNLTKAAKTIGWKESSYNKNIDIPSALDERSAKKTAGEARETYGGREMSRGLTQMKDEENLNETLRSKYVKGKGSNLSLPTESAIPTFYALSSRYLYLKDLAVKNNLKLTSDELSQLSMLAWNQPITRVGESLKKYKNFNNVMGAYRSNGELAYDLAFDLYNEKLE